MGVVRNEYGGWTVRTRVLVSLLAMTFLGMSLSGSFAYLYQRDRVDDRINDTLTRIADDFVDSVSFAADPFTNEPFTTTSEVLRAAMLRVLPIAHGGSVGVIDGRAEWVSPVSRGIHPERDPKFIALFNDVDIASEIVIGSYESTLGSLRYLAAPTKLTTDDTVGVYIVTIDRDREMEQLTESYCTYAWVASVAFCFIMLIGWGITNRLTQPIRWVGATAERITKEDLSERIPVRGSDDLARLSQTLNGMLDRLEVAITAERRLLDDVSHELRTPITIIRGNLDVIDPNDPEDIIESTEIAIDELDRMSKLVDSLILLARSKRPEVSQLKDVDIATLTDEILAKARRLDDREWECDGRAAIHATVDAQLVTQAVLQMAANAVRYSDSDTAIAIGSKRVGDTVRIWVRDHGVGIPAEFHNRIFDRFARVHVGRGEDGSGLGLPIVQAIAVIHGGEIQVDSAPGEGSTFTMVLPLQSTPAETHGETEGTGDGNNPRR